MLTPTDSLPKKLSLKPYWDKSKFKRILSNFAENPNSESAHTRELAKNDLAASSRAAEGEQQQVFPVVQLSHILVKKIITLIALLETAPSDAINPLGV